jgi:hypothetical protein
MKQFNYDSYCGNYCGACEIMSAYKNNTQNEIASQWGASPEEIKCFGCKTETVYKNCSICKIRKCAIERGTEHCVVCKDFPCEILQSGESLVEQLPHLKEIPLNMQTMKEKGQNIGLQSRKENGNVLIAVNPFPGTRRNVAVAEGISVRIKII